MRFFNKKFRWTIIYSIFLTLFTAFVLLDTFLIPKTTNGIHHDSANSDIYNSSGKTASGIFTDTSYKDDSITINITEICKYDTQIHIADIKISDISILKTAFANDTYGRNIKETTSDIAYQNKAILAINGDFYGFRDYGYVVRNGVYYRGVKSQESGSETLAIMKNGELNIFSDTDYSCRDIYDQGAVQIFSFGPGLVKSGNVSVTEGQEVGKALASNPRTAIGSIKENDGSIHYLFVVSDGRTSKSAGLSLYQLANVMKELGCDNAYNFDGGGSSTMYFNGNIINIPTDGKTFGERKVSDIVYIGY